MTKLKLLVVIVGLVFVTFGTTIAQVNSSMYAQQYRSAKSLFDQDKFALAMEGFKPIIQNTVGNPFVTYASFYYALSAYREGYIPMAKNMLLQVRDKYPKWSKINEVNIWLANIYFENNEANSALNVLKAVDEKQSTVFVNNLKRYHISKIEDTEAIQSLFENNQNDKVVAEIFAKKLANLPLADQNQNLLNELIKDFDLDAEVLNVSFVEKSVFKDEYRVAVMLPFLLETIQPKDNKKVNQFVIDFYQGVQLALDSLKASGINIKLYAYDTKRSKEATAKILERKEILSMDLIIGPLFEGPETLVKEFAYENQINAINPFFTDSKIIVNNPFSFLYRPTSERIGVTTADYVAEHARNKVGVIFYGTSAQDSVLAFSYKKQIEENGFNIILNKEIGKDNSRSILDVLLISNSKMKEAASDEGREKLTIGLDSIGHIFVASNNDLISTKVVSAVETRGDSIMLIGSSDWMELPSINFDTYSRLNTLLYASAFISKEGAAYALFRKKYVNMHKKPPTKFVEDGFELMMFMGKSLKEHGKYFQLGWNEEKKIRGYMSYGFDYQNSNDNQVVPLLMFKEDEMNVILGGEKQKDGDR